MKYNDIIIRYYSKLFFVQVIIHFHIVYTSVRYKIVLLTSNIDLLDNFIEDPRHNWLKQYNNQICPNVSK